MPKATLTFNLPEEKEDYKITNNALNLYSALHDINNTMRSMLKYDHTLTDDQRNLLEKLNDEFSDYIGDLLD